MCKRKIDTLDQLNSEFAVEGSTTTPTSDLTSKRLKTLTDRQTDLQDGRKYVNAKYSNRNNPFKGKYTFRQVLTEFDDYIKLQQAAIAVLQAQQTLEENFAGTVVAKKSDSGVPDGDCHITFVNIGIGDCTFIVTPQGTRILVDCGSNGMSDVILDPKFLTKGGPTPQKYVQDALRDGCFNGNFKLDILVLTHPDEDHYNQYKKILGGLGVSVGIVYFGGTVSFDSYYVGGASGYFKGLVKNNTNLLRSVVIRQEPTPTKNPPFTTQIDGKTPIGPATPRALGKEFIDANTDSDTYNAVVVYYEQDAKTGSDFKLSFLAGNVTGAWSGSTFYTSDEDLKGSTEEKGEGTQNNKGSLMVLVECFGQRALICGDATVVTEMFAITRYPKLFGTIQTVRTGHHGSPTSSCKKFVNSLTKMELAVISTGGLNTSIHHLPQSPIVNLYVAPAYTNTVSPHTIFAFDEGNARENIGPLTKPVYATGSNRSVPLVWKKTS